MIVEYVHYHLGDKASPSFVSAYEGAGRYLSACRHCVHWELRQSIEEPGHYVVRMEWDSLEGHTIHWRTDPSFVKFRELVEPFAWGRSDMNHYALVATGPA